MSKWRRGSQRERLHQVSDVPKSERAGDRTNLGGAYWARGKEWNYTSAALQGSSFYKLPKILQWFTGNIGFHHIHHLSPLSSAFIRSEQWMPTQSRRGIISP